MMLDADRFTKTEQLGLMTGLAGAMLLPLPRFFAESERGFL